MNTKSNNIDLDEISPNSFIVHNDRVFPVLKGEGVRQGHTFVLVSERRAGLLGRLRERGFNVRTLWSRLKRLPALPRPMALGPALEREVPPKERWSIFDIDDLGWKTIEPIDDDGRKILRVAENQIIRRRKSRSGGSYFRAEASAKYSLNFVPLDQEQAILHGYAQATIDSDIEVEARAAEEGAYELIINYTLPKAYLELLKMTGSDTEGGILFQAKDWPIAVQALHQLNLRPEVGDQSITNPDIDPTYMAEESDFDTENDY